MMRTTRFLALALLFAPLPAAAQVTAFVDGRIIDGTGKVTEHGTVLVRDGRIVSVGPATTVKAPAGATTIDLRGKTLMPGIVNAHGHLAAADGLKSGPEYYTRENLQRQLRAYATYGVTTVFALGDDQAAAFALRAEQSEGPPGRARVFLAGPSIAAETAEAARADTDKTIALKPDLIKLRIDDNLGTTKKMPEAAWRATLERAHAARLRLAVHLFYLADAKAVAQAGADFVAHSVRDLPVDEAFLAAMKKSGACYSPTLMREVSTFVYEGTPAWANDPFFQRGYSADLSAELADPARQARFRASPAWAAGQKYKAGLEVAKGNLKRVSDAGIRIAMGTDSGPAGRFQGFFEHLELEMMVASGLTPMQAIVAATGNAAACWGKQGQIGAIAPGAAADLLVLNANPLDAITNTRAIDAVYIGGRRFDPPTPPAPEYGPARGTLFIVGGNMQDSSGVPQKFIELAGGPSKKFVVIPTNGGNRNPDGTLRVYEEAKVLAEWRKRGLTNVVMLHTADPKVADTEAFVKPLLDADAVWFDGGRQWNSVDSYMNTRTVAELWKVLDRGGVIGGSSAGATIQSDYLVRGDTSGPDVMMTQEPNHQHGFAFLKHSAIDQHINSRNRWDDLVPVVKKFPEYLGLGLSEDTAIIVRGDRFEVFGRWKVAVHDNQRAYEPWEKPYFVLSHGDVYNMKTRKVEKYGTGTPPRGANGANPGGE